MNQKEIEQLAEIRGQLPVLVYIDEKPHWLLVDEQFGSIDYLATSLNTDAWEDYNNGLFTVKNKDGQIIDDNRLIYFLTNSPFHFTRS